MKLEDRQPENSSFDVLRMSRKHLGKTIHGDLGKENKLAFSADPNAFRRRWYTALVRWYAVGTPRKNIFSRSKCVTILKWGEINVSNVVYSQSKLGYRRCRFNRNVTILQRTKTKPTCVDHGPSRGSYPIPRWARQHRSLQIILSKMAYAQQQSDR